MRSVGFCYFTLIFKSAPLAINISRHSKLLETAAKWAAVIPLLFCTFTSQPASSNRRTMSFLKQKKKEETENTLPLQDWIYNGKRRVEYLLRSGSHQNWRQRWVSPIQKIASVGVKTLEIFRVEIFPPPVPIFFHRNCRL